MKKYIEKIILSLDRFLLFILSRKSPTKKSNKVEKKILLIRCDAIGDFILWLDSARHFKVIYPIHKIHVVIDDSLKELAIASMCFDDIAPLNVKKFKWNYFYRIKQILNLRAKDYDLVIESTKSRSLLVGDSIARFAKSHQKFASNGDCQNISKSQKNISDKFYDHLIYIEDRNQHELIFNNQFINAISKEKIDFSYPKITIGNKKSLRTTRKLRLVVMPGASWIGKIWPPFKYSELIELLYDVYGENLETVLCGTNSEVNLCKEIISEINIKSRHLLSNIAGETNFDRLIETLEASDLLIGNDSASVHLAVAVRIPSIVILGGGHYGRFHPYPKLDDLNAIAPKVAHYKMDCYGCNWKCIYKQQKSDNNAMRCIASISVSKVYEMAREVFDKKYS